MDKWNAIEHEGLITAIAAAHTTLGEGKIYTPRGGRSDAVLQDSTHPKASFIGHPTVSVPPAYVEGGIGARISGTVAGGYGGGMGRGRARG